ncbi:NAD(P)-dependent oxidoreductase [Streptococcaceae bacterium ESL0687]|nr:NAD(P)-dependent oxidoreductase [Streptococcaceae bacterium ESL0687]
MKIGFIGMGVMGHAIVRHFMAAGHEVTIYTRTKAKALDLFEEGAKWATNPCQLTNESDVIFTMVGYPQDVEEIYYGAEGIFKGEVKGKLLIDLTTSTPSLAERIYQTAKDRGAEALDAPVSGGDLGARNASLSIMVGGDEKAFQRALPLFELIGKTFSYQGAAGKGQHTKMANQIMIAGTMTGMTELLVYAQRAGLDLEKVIETVGGGAAGNWSLTNYSPRILKEDFSPGFFVKHFIKDLGIALDEADKMDIELPATSLAKKLYDNLADKGFEDDGTQALIKLWWNK